MCRQAWQAWQARKDRWTPHPKPPKSFSACVLKSLLPAATLKSLLQQLFLSSSQHLSQSRITSPPLFTHTPIPHSNESLTHIAPSSGVQTHPVTLFSRISSHTLQLLF